MVYKLIEVSPLKGGKFWKEKPEMAPVFKKGRMGTMLDNVQEMSQILPSHSFYKPGINALENSVGKHKNFSSK